MEQHIEAAKLMVSVQEETDTMLQAVDMIDGRFPEVTREHLMLLWIGTNAATLKSIPSQKAKDLLELTLHYQEWIGALPDDVIAALPAMPGIDGDWAGEVIDTVKSSLSSGGDDAKSIEQPLSEIEKLELGGGIYVSEDLKQILKRSRSTNS